MSDAMKRSLETNTSIDDTAVCPDRAKDSGLSFLSKPRLCSDEVSAYLERAHGLSVATRTLDKWRSVGGDGPRFLKFGRKVLYDRDEVDSWAMAKLGKPRRNTSEER